jgi:hypothetical protein
VPFVLALSAKQPEGGSTVEYFSRNGFHHPWRSTAWEIHPIIKIQVLE